MNLGTLFFLCKHMANAASTAAIASPITPPLTPGEVVTLEFLLNRTKPSPIREIVSCTGLAQSWVSVVVQSLVKRGWADATTEVSDRRTTTVSLKPEVISATRRMLSRSAASALVALVPTASDSEFCTIERGLVTLAEVLFRQEQHSPPQRVAKRLISRIKK